MASENGFRSVASILGIGTASPPNIFDQETYPDFYFRITKTQHDSRLKDKFKHLCERTEIKKRYMYFSEDILNGNPSICEYMSASLDARQSMTVTAVPELGRVAALKAIREWGQPVSRITHLIFCTSSCIEMPGADYHLAKLLGLHPSVRRFLIFGQGCNGGATVLRLAKDLAENNAGARVLVVSAENILCMFRGPGDDDMENLVGQALFGDGAGAAIVGSDPLAEVERSIFELSWAGQTLLPNSEGLITCKLREVGLIVKMLKSVPDVISENIGDCLKEAFRPLRISDWNSIFWACHPGGRAILDKIRAKLRLQPEKLHVTRHVLAENGNMASACVFFVMDEMRKSSGERGLKTTGEGLKWGVLFGFGPGITVETIVIRSTPLPNVAE